MLSKLHNNRPISIYSFLFSLWVLNKVTFVQCDNFFLCLAQHFVYSMNVSFKKTTGMVQKIYLCHAFQLSDTCLVFTLEFHEVPLNLWPLENLNEILDMLFSNRS